MEQKELIDVLSNMTVKQLADLAGALEEEWGVTAAAAVAVGRQLGQSAPDGVAEWIRARFHESGGFFALPGAPMPDLLSTATALHTLSGLECDIEPFRELGLDYLDSLWTNKGAFHGHWADEYLDCEYTWYGLLTLGHLGL